ncbi:MAG: CarD family transcriptional regulator [Pseudomonadota bacterium]
MLNDESFRVGDMVVYPSHGVGEIIGEEIQIIADQELKVFIISLLKEKMLLRVPVKRAVLGGLRPLCSNETISGIFNTLQKKSRATKGMWSKRAQEYEVKINSGDVNLLAEVVRDLYKNSDDPGRSYSERVIYESALNRLAGEFAVVKGIELENAKDQLLTSLEEREYAA